MVEAIDTFRQFIAEGIPSVLPSQKPFNAEVDHAPNRRQVLSGDEKVLSLQNALRYFEPRHHDVLIPEFLDELNTYGRIIMRRFKPDEYPMKDMQLMTIPQSVHKPLPS